LPLIVLGIEATSPGTDNIIAALEHSNRVCEISLTDPADWQWEQVLATMQVPFPELTHLTLSSYDETPSVIPDSFLGGSAPSLRNLTLEGIPFPGLPTLLLSATHLVYLRLSYIPDSGYISPEAMVALLSALSSLRSLYLEFQSPQPSPDSGTRSLPPPKRSILPALRGLEFRGVTEYLEDFVIIVDAPQLNNLQITFFNQIDFNTQQLAQFIDRTPKLGKRNEAHVRFDYMNVYFLFGAGCLEICIPCREPDRKLSSVAQVCNSFLPSMVEDLYIERQPIYLDLVWWQNDAIENTVWLQLLLPFIAVKNLYLSKEFGLGIAAALQELVGARITEVLPSLQNIFVEELQPWGPLQEKIGQFVAARQLSDHPIAISDWHKDLGVLPVTFPDLDNVSDDNGSNMELM
jgi:hypothetical protein